MKIAPLLFSLLVSLAVPARCAEANADITRLAEEVRGLGWIVFPARSGTGDWDLFLMRPDGSQRRALTTTPTWNEAAPQFSRDGSRLLYRRLNRWEKIEGNRYGEQGTLVIANSDGTDERLLGAEGQFPWASWSPDGKELVCLSLKGVFFVEVSSGNVLRTLPRNGFFQQLTWSPDGKWVCGVANSFGTGWSVARMSTITGEVNPISKVDCCTPDWFPGGRELIFSNRPSGQKANRGVGWTQLWAADAEGHDRRLIYGENGRHVYGGHVSPDGRYVLFTGNPQEDGDPEHNGAPMGLLRLSDAPIIGGESEELRALYPNAKSGPVLALPAGWEPCWTSSESPAGRLTAATRSGLAVELHSYGWIAFSAQTPQGDWDLFLSRPDGSERRALTDTREFNEAGVRFSPDGRRLLYYRMAKSDAVDNNTYGTFDLVLADSKGSNAVVYGRDFPWASWGPDGHQIASLTPKGIQIVDVESRQVVRILPRRGLVQQLIWSPDGSAFTGTANGLGAFWNIGQLGVVDGSIHSVSETERYNCTPDWCPEGRRILYARGIIPKQPGRAQLWVASADGRTKTMLYAEAGRHIYGACSSPDGKYLLFTRSKEDLGAVGQSQTTMAIVRWADTPMIGDDSKELHEQYPDATPACRLDLGPGWEPHWTLMELPVER